MKLIDTNSATAPLCGRIAAGAGCSAAAALVVLGSTSAFKVSALLLLLAGAALVQASAAVGAGEGHAGLGACVCVGRPSGRLRVKRAAWLACTHQGRGGRASLGVIQFPLLRVRR